MDDERPASKKDLEELKAELKAEIGRLDQRIEHQSDQLLEAMRDMQTELLRAFGPFQEVVNLRIRTVEANTSNDSVAVKARLDIVERRLFQIERKLLLEPPS